MPGQRSTKSQATLHVVARNASQTAPAKFPVVFVKDKEARLRFRAIGSCAQAATTLIRPVFRERGFRRITISTSWSSAVNRFIDGEARKLVVT